MAKISDRILLGLDAYKLQLYALLFFSGVLGFALGLEIPFDIAGTELYFIDHFLFGLGFPFLIFAFSGKFSWGIVVSLFWSVGNEFFEDQWSRQHFSLDVDHFMADLLGIFVAWLVYRRFWRPMMHNQ